MKVNNESKVVRAWIAPDFTSTILWGIVEGNKLRMGGAAETKHQASEYLKQYCIVNNLILGVVAEFSSLVDCQNSLIE